jgi:hypothetical protein
MTRRMTKVRFCPDLAHGLGMDDVFHLNDEVIP